MNARDLQKLFELDCELIRAASQAVGYLKSCGSEVPKDIARRLDLAVTELYELGKPV